MSESQHTYSANSREQILIDLEDDSVKLRWVPVALVRDHPAITEQSRKDNQRCLMMGQDLIDDDTEAGIDTWFLIHGMIQDRVLEEIEHDADPYSVCEYVVV